MIRLLAGLAGLRTTCRQRKRVVRGKAGNPGRFGRFFHKHTYTHAYVGETLESSCQGCQTCKFPRAARRIEDGNSTANLRSTCQPSAGEVF